MTTLLPTVRPSRAVPGGRVAIEGVDVPLSADGPPRVRIGAESAHVLAASSRRISAVVPASAEGGSLVVRLDETSPAIGSIEVARPFVTGVHQVDSPAFDALGRLYATHSGGRETKVAVPLYRIGSDGVREPIVVEIANPTSMALGPDDCLYVSSRFDGNVYRLWPDDRLELYATELGVPTGLAFGPDGALYVGDRSGSILRVSADRQVENFATLPASVAAFHLAFGPDGALYVAAPTLATHDPVYRISPDRLVDVVCDGFGRPQGLAFDSTGLLYVTDALAGSSGVYRLDVSTARPQAELIVSGPTLIGLAFDPRGGVLLCSNDTIWRLEEDVKPWVRH